MGAEGPEPLVGRIVVESLPCVQCGYDLHGIRAEGQCSECGLSVPLSLAGSIDPEAHRLPPMTNPRAVGGGLVLAAGGLAVAVTLVFAWAAAFMPLIWRPEMFSGKLAVRSLRGIPFEPVTTMGVAACISILVGVVAWLSLRPESASHANRPRNRSLRRLLVGFLLLAVAFAVMPWFIAARSVAALLISPDLPIVGVVLALWGLQGILAEVGARSRVFRRSGVRRQRIPTLIASLGIMAVCWLGMTVSERCGSESGTVIFLTLGLTSFFVALVGHWYLFINTIWIHRALKEPPPRLTSLLSPRSANLAGSESEGGAVCQTVGGRSANKST